MSTSRPSPYDPLAELNRRFDEMRGIAHRMVLEIERRQRTEFDLQKRLQDALDRVHELETLVREKDQMIAELQELRARGR